MKNYKTYLLASALAALSFLVTGCASIVCGTQQKVTVHTIPECGASCYLQNNKGKWYLPCTPATVCVHRSYGDMTITAEKPGYQSTVMHVKSRTKGMLCGNALFGGVIGTGVDCADGAAYDYPDTVWIPMNPCNYRGR